MDFDEMNEGWEKQAPTLAAIEKENPFLLPTGYFEKMAEQIHAQINIHQFDTDSSILEMPENYFDNLEERITSVIKMEQLKGSDVSEIYTIPENYFNTLEGEITSKVYSKSSQPKIRTLISKWTTYAAAACIMGFIGIGVYLNTKNNNIENQFSKLPSDEIVNYLQLYSDVGDAPIILKSLDNKIEFSDINSEISDQEIKQYLELNL